VYTEHATAAEAIEYLEAWATRYERYIERNGRN